MKNAALAIALALLAGTAHAADPSTFGETEYTNSCAQCHGASGKGDGPMAGYLEGSLPDLTQLQKNNGGVFPLTQVYKMIDGSGTMGPHGTREMPAWGNRYSLEAEGQLGFDFGGARETYVRTRILALIEHLASLQEQ